jgi:nucleotide-binding universal stress UspA family protein
MFKSVVVGASGSEAGARAVQRAIEVAQASGGTLHIVTAIRAHRPNGPVLPEEFRYSVGPVDPADVLLSELGAAASAARVPVSTHTVLADPVEAITRIAAEEEADLIVVGAPSSHGVHHRHGVPGALAAAAPCAVLVV